MKKWENSVIEVIGPSGAGKTTFANRHLGASCGARSILHQPATISLMETHDWELRRDSPLFRNSYMHIWEAKERNEAKSSWPKSVLGERLKWYWEVMTLDAFLRQHHFPEYVFLLDDTLVTAFFPELTSLPLGGEEGFLQHMEGRKIINVTATKNAIVRRQLEREKAGEPVPSFQGQDAEFIRKWAQSTIRRRKNFQSFEAKSGLTSIEWVDVRGRWGLRRADQLVASECRRNNASK